MRLATFLAPDSDRSIGGEVQDGCVGAFGDGSSVLDRIAGGDLSPATGDRYGLSEVELLAPITRLPNIYGVGLNYRSHAAEIGAEPPEFPVIFPKGASSSTGPSGPVFCPSVVKRLDYEGELAVIIGRDSSIFGFAVADDISARDLQAREPHWVRAKGADSFCPWGPWITTADEIADPTALVVKAWVNGDLRQEAPVSDLVHPIADIVSFIEEAISLVPGDMILTGTPAGVGMGMDPKRFLEDGDVVRIEIEPLGSIEHPISTR